MRIVVCVKQVSDPTTARYDVVAERVEVGEPVPNPLDLVAVEEALRLRENMGGEVLALTVGPAPADAVLRRTLLLGADRAVRVDVWRDSLDHEQRAFVLARALERLGYDLVLCGSRSADLQTEYVGTAVAKHLGLPTLARVVAIECRRTGTLRLHKKTERGRREVYECRLPALMTVEEELCTPRYVPILARAYRVGLSKKIDVLALSDVGVAESDFPPSPYSASATRPRPRTKGASRPVSFWEQMEAQRRPSQGTLPVSAGGARECVARLREWLKESRG